MSRTAGEGDAFGRPRAGLRRRLHDVIFGIDTPAGRGFDLALIVCILVSVAIVVLDSIRSLHDAHRTLFAAVELGFTALFSVEYAARLACVERPLRYAMSFYGMVDLLAVLPSWLGLLLPNAGLLLDVRVLRLLRIFRVLRLGRFVAEFGALGRALRASRHKVFVFLFVVLLVVLLMGTLMYVVEGPEHGFTSIPIGVYWAITTMTTVGFGDITPGTDLGRFLASVMMLLGWGTLAVPTGIVTSEFTFDRLRPRGDGRPCPACAAVELEPMARFCRYCGTSLP